MSILEPNHQSGDKRTLLAIVLSVVVITVGFLLQAKFFPVTPAQPSNQTTSVTAPAPSPVSSQDAPTAAQPASPGPAAITAAPPVAVTGAAAADVPTAVRQYKISTDILEAVLTNKGGDLVSLKLKKHSDKEGFVDLLVPGAQGAQGLALGFGDTAAPPVTNYMNAMMLNDSTIEFSRTFFAAVAGKAEPVPFTLKKTYSFKDGEYMFGLTVALENSVNEILPLDNTGYAYTLSIGPQIGPRLTGAPGSRNTDFRKFVSLVGGKKKEESPKAGVPFVQKEQPTWVAISGKYFSLVAVPELTSFKTTLMTSQDPVLFQSNSLALSRPAIKASKSIDSYFFYFGPKTNSELSKYDYADRNAFQRSGLNLEQAAESSGILGWLEAIMKFFLNLCFKLVPNYGIAIIMVTILVKVILFPLTRNGSISAAKMQELKPKIDELQAKYKSNPQKLNQEMAEFYKKEGYNPMSGCLPLLIQFPIFIAMYNLFNNHFDLRGAMFIPGWIPDLSQPEAIFRFPLVNLMVWQIDAIRALPIIYLVSQLLYGKYTQMTQPGQSAAQMKIMMFGMPIMFFFILYNTPSGLLVYWIVSNLLSIGQQVAINDLLKKRKAALAAAASVIAPNRKISKSKRK